MMIFMMVLMATIITMVSRDSQSSDVTRFCQQQALWLDQGPGVNSTVTCHPSSNLNLDLNDRDGDGSYISCHQLVNSPFYIFCIQKLFVNLISTSHNSSQLSVAVL